MIFNKDKFEYVDHILKDPENPEGSGVREIIALAKYNGKTYRGSAKCHPEDTFDPTIGEEIAARRCDLAIRRARMHDRVKAEYNAQIAADEAARVAELTTDKVIKAENEWYDAQDEYANYMLWLENR